jgi:hypothetical protein
MVVYGLKNRTKIVVIARGVSEKGVHILDTRSEEQNKKSQKCVSWGVLFSRATISVEKGSILCR